MNEINHEISYDNSRFSNNRFMHTDLREKEDALPFGDLFFVAFLLYYIPFIVFVLPFRHFLLFSVGLCVELNVKAASIIFVFCGRLVAVIE